MSNKRWLAALMVAGLTVGAIGALGGCSVAKSAFSDGQNQAKQGNWDAAVVHYTRAAREDPDNIEYRMALERALREASKFHVQEARKFMASEDLEQAIEEFALANQLDRSNQYAQQELVDARQALAERQDRRQEASQFEQRREQARQLLTTQPVLEPSSAAPVNLRFAQDTSLQRIFEVLSTLSGINVLFDEAFRDRRVTDALDPNENVEGGTQYLRRQLDDHDGDLSLALAAYNAGPRAVARYGGVPPYPETQKYVRRVLDLYNHAGGQAGGIPQ